MRELFKEFPDPDVVLSLEPEELGARLLFYIQRRIERESRPHVHPRNLAGEIGNIDLSRGEGGYPASRVDELQIAVTEALSWLQNQGLLIPTIDGNASSGWMILSRRGRRFQELPELQAFTDARKLNRDLLHPDIRDKVWRAFIREEFDAAIFQAFRQVEIRVREASGLGQRPVGVALMRSAFGATGPLRDKSSETAEAEAMEHLFAGSIGLYKNPQSHRVVGIEDASKAIEIVSLASHLLRIVDELTATNSRVADHNT